MTETRTTLAEAIKTQAEKVNQDTYLVIKANGKTYTLDYGNDLEVAADHLKFTDQDGVERLVPTSLVTGVYTQEA